MTTRSRGLSLISVGEDYTDELRRRCSQLGIPVYQITAPVYLIHHEDGTATEHQTRRNLVEVDKLDQWLAKWAWPLRFHVAHIYEATSKGCPMIDVRLCDSMRPARPLEILAREG